MLSRYDYIMLPVLGVVRAIKKGWRRIHTTFGGVGLFYLPTEQFICRLNMFLQHYHTSSAISRKLEASLRYLMLQLGCTSCPFELDYTTWSPLAPLTALHLFGSRNKKISRAGLLRRNSILARTKSEAKRIRTTVEKIARARLYQLQ